MILKENEILFYMIEDYTNNTYLYDILWKNEFYGVLSWIKHVWIKDIDKHNIQSDPIFSENIDKLVCLFHKFNIDYKIMYWFNRLFWNNWHRILIYWRELTLVNSLCNNSDEVQAKVFWYPNCCIKSRSIYLVNKWNRSSYIYSYLVYITVKILYLKPLF